MGFELIEYIAPFTLRDQHTFAMKRLAHRLTDSLEVTVDGRRILEKRVGPQARLFEHSHAFTLEEIPLELVWRWNLFTGDPLYIVLRTGKRLLAIYGTPKRLSGVGSQTGNPHSPEDIHAFQKIRDEVEMETAKEVSREDFPLDNSAGSDTLTVEREVSTTLSTTLSITNQEQLQGSIKVTLLKLLESQIASQLSQTTNQEIGGSKTDRQQVRFSVKAGQCTVYRITWMAQQRTGTYHVTVDNSPLQVSYVATYGLSPSIQSRACGESPSGSGN